MIKVISISFLGIRLESLIEQAIDPKNVEVEARQHATKVVAIYLENALNFQRRLFKRRMIPHKILRFLNLPYKPFFITMMYILSKMLYLVNIFAQFLSLNFFLQSSRADGVYGWKALFHVLNGTQWSTSGFFPRDTLCDLQVNRAWLKSALFEIFAPWCRGQCFRHSSAWTGFNSLRLHYFFFVYECPDSFLRALVKR